MSNEPAATTSEAMTAQAQANELLRVLNREVFNDSIDIDKLPHGVGIVEDLINRVALQVRQESERRIKEKLPKSYFADRGLLLRIALIVNDWQRAIVSNQRLEAEVERLRKELAALKGDRQ